MRLRQNQSQISSRAKHVVSLLLQTKNFFLEWGPPPSPPLENWLETHSIHNATLQKYKNEFEQLMQEIGEEKRDALQKLLSELFCLNINIYKIEEDQQSLRVEREKARGDSPQGATEKNYAEVVSERYKKELAIKELNLENYLNVNKKILIFFSQNLPLILPIAQAWTRHKNEEEIKFNLESVETKLKKLFTHQDLQELGVDEVQQLGVKLSPQIAIDRQKKDDFPIQKVIEKIGKRLNKIARKIQQEFDISLIERLNSELSIEVEKIILAGRHFILRRFLNQKRSPVKNEDSMIKELESTCCLLKHSLENKLAKKLNELFESKNKKPAFNLGRGYKIFRKILKELQSTVHEQSCDQLSRSITLEEEKLKILQMYIKVQVEEISREHFRLMEIQSLKKDKSFTIVDTKLSLLDVELMKKNEDLIEILDQLHYVSEELKNLNHIDNLCRKHLKGDIQNLKKKLNQKIYLEIKQVLSSLPEIDKKSHDIMELSRTAADEIAKLHELESHLKFGLSEYEDSRIKELLDIEKQIIYELHLRLNEKITSKIQLIIGNLDNIITMLNPTNKTQLSEQANCEITTLEELTSHIKFVSQEHDARIKLILNQSKEKTDDFKAKLAILKFEEVRKQFESKITDLKNEFKAFRKVNQIRNKLDNELRNISLLKSSVRAELFMQGLLFETHNEAKKKLAEEILNLDALETRCDNLKTDLENNAEAFLRSLKKDIEETRWEVGLQFKSHRHNGNPIPTYVDKQIKIIERADKGELTWVEAKNEVCSIGFKARKQNNNLFKFFSRSASTSRYYDLFKENSDDMNKTQLFTHKLIKSNRY